MVVLFGRPFVYIFLGIESSARLLRLIQGGNHFIGIYPVFQAQVDGSPFTRIEQVVAFVLRIIDTERITDILRRGMHLQTQVAPSHRIEEVETDREVLPEACFHRSTQQVACLIEHQVVGSHLEQLPFHLQIQAVLFGDAIEAPSEVILFLVEVAHLLHPLAAPGSRIEERHHTEGTVSRLLQPIPHRLTGNHLRHSGDMCIQPEVHLRQQLFLQVVAYVPVDKVTALVMQRWRFFPVLHAQTINLLTTETLLYLPARHIGIDQHIGFGHQTSGTGAPDDNQSVRLLYLFTTLLHPALIQKIRITEGGAATEKAVVRQIRIRHRFDLFHAFEEHLRMNDQ